MPTNGQVYLPTGTNEVPTNGYNDSAYQRAQNAYQRALVPTNGYRIDSAYQWARNAYQRHWYLPTGTISSLVFIQHLFLLFWLSYHNLAAKLFDLFAFKVSR